MEPAQRIEDLIVWQRACELRDLVHDMIRQAPVRSNRRFCRQIETSSASVPANVAEGFGRYFPKENAAFVRVAKASLLETRNYLQEGRTKRYWHPEQFSRAWRLSCRVLKAIVPYLLYLESCAGKLPADRQEPRT
ncbi:MAG TPA: four helix bundle protein [Vicinamibacterales bacterium]|nr:four helix bundle protein [Vicinamibacterales bacterium]